MLNPFFSHPATMRLHICYLIVHRLYKKYYYFINSFFSLFWLSLISLFFFPFLAFSHSSPSHFSISVSSLSISLFSISHSSLYFSILFSPPQSPSLRISDCWFGGGVLVMELNRWLSLVVANRHGSHGSWALGLINVSEFWRSILGRGIWLAVVAGDSMVGLAVAMGVDLGGCL